MKMFHIPLFSLMLGVFSPVHAQYTGRSQCEEAAQEMCEVYYDSLQYSSVAACVGDQIQPACNDGGGNPPSIVSIPGGRVCVYWGSGPGHTATGGC